ncbi:hypothetical protein DFH07DRAFT_459105 [Mycena maculata]|uniref:F-box domain-containing protein n=1 Tax=Mycena maculata TaxID=230809 RepID=A0AAD7NER3_9AGAR|nr:hypothetical protein DFH07DRAFT_459105 [Mycena maculata]
MSVEELRTAIENICIDIERQKEVLKTLETSKSRLQSQLNAVLDPVERLPLEISSEIFVQCLPPLPEPGAHHLPILLLNVCNSWSRIALSIPTLWTAIHVQFPRLQGFEKLLEIWLQRAHNRPLSISLHGTFEASIATILSRRAEQLENLEINHDQINAVNVDPLSGIGPGPFPLLKSLTIGSVLNQAYPSLDPNSILDLFHLAPNLVECTFYWVLIPADELPRGLRVLPNLRHLRFGKSLPCLADIELLRYLTLPGLQTLAVSVITSDDDSDEEVLIAFLKRSSPPLQKLRICENGSGGPFPFTKMEECLRLLPTLTHIELWDPSDDLVQKLFAILASPSLLHLQSVRMFGYWGDVPPTSWAVLHHALVGRRTHFTHFTIKCLVYGSSDTPYIKQPDAEICDAFRQLVVDGMEIFIGYEGQNWISV